MLIFVYILLLKLLSTYSYEIIDILPFKRTALSFTKLNTYQIIKYSHHCPYLKITTFYLRILKKSSYDLYIYRNKENIYDENGSFQNYILSTNIKEEILFTNANEGDYYIVIQYSNELKTEIMVYSSDSPIEMDTNLVYNQFTMTSSSKSLNYIFKIYVNNTKFARFGAKDLTNNAITWLTIKDDSDTIVSQKYLQSNESYFKLNNDTTYYFNFTLFYSGWSNLASINVFLMLSNYSNYIYVEKNKKDYDTFCFIKKIDLLLNISSIEEGNNLIVEYSSNIEYNGKFTALGFETDDIDMIQKYTYIPLDFNEDEECFNKEMCEGYITKNISNLKIVLFRIESSNNFIPYIKFRYGKEQIIYPNRVWVCFLLGLGLALPNILLQITRRCNNKITASCPTLVMNIILNFGYGMVLSIIFDIERFIAIILACVIITIYIFISLICLCCQCCCGERCFFDVIYNLCHKLEDSKTLHEIVSFNRKLPPLIYVGCKAQHKESREVWEEYEQYQRAVYNVTTKTDSYGITSTKKRFSHYETDYKYRTTHYSSWGRVDEGGGRFRGVPGYTNSNYKKSVEYRTVVTWRKELEYKYSSWEDITENINGIKYCAIVEAHFSYSIEFDQISKNILKNMKMNFMKKEKHMILMLLHTMISKYLI